ncbi:MAG: glycoside hydrolase family 2 TIM barrel-domain containing protein [Candidatus Hydrogenedentota bacterium]
MKKLVIVFLIFPSILFSKNISIKNNLLYVADKPFYILGVGWEPGCRYGSLPWERKFEPELIRWDFEMIKEMNANTIRGWGEYKGEELELAKEYGLKVIQGIWVDYNKYFVIDEDNQNKILNDIKNIIKKNKQYDHILFYLVMNEPRSDLLIDVGPEEFNRRFINLRNAVKEADTDALVSFSNCPLTDYIDFSIWDVVCFNVYPYGPETLRYAMGYNGYINWLKREIAKDKPLIITELGLSVSPEGPGKGGYGGNTLEEQADGMEKMMRSILNTKVAGLCPFMWTDGWWKSPQNRTPENKFIHDPHPEEWFGITEVVDTINNIFGRPRPVYYTIQKIYSEVTATEQRPEDTEPVLDTSLIVSISAPSEVVSGESIAVHITGPSLKNLYLTIYDYYSNQPLNSEIILNNEGTYNFEFPTLLRYGYYGFACGYGSIKNLPYADLAIVYVKKSGQTGIDKLVSNLNKEVYENFESYSPFDIGSLFKEKYTGVSALNIFLYKDITNQGINFIHLPVGSNAWAYTSLNFAKPYSLKDVKYFGLRIKGDNSKNIMRVYLKDMDNERWFYTAVPINFEGWSDFIFPLNTLFRDPYDGIKDGNSRLDDNISGMSFVIVGNTKTDIVIDDLVFYTALPQ